MRSDKGGWGNTRYEERKKREARASTYVHTEAAGESKTIVALLTDDAGSLCRIN
jgi:hypothetical protein